jgi:hypothetical protein
MKFVRHLPCEARLKSQFQEKPSWVPQVSLLRPGIYDDRMPRNLVRYQQSGDLHFITFSCYGRRPYLDTTEARDQFERSLETMRLHYNFWITGYVVMPNTYTCLLANPQAFC